MLNSLASKQSSREIPYKINDNGINTSVAGDTYHYFIMCSPGKSFTSNNFQLFLSKKGEIPSTETISHTLLQISERIIRIEVVIFQSGDYLIENRIRSTYSLTQPLFVLCNAIDLNRCQILLIKQNGTSSDLTSERQLREVESLMLICVDRYGNRIESARQDVSLQCSGDVAVASYNCQYDGNGVFKIALKLSKKSRQTRDESTKFSLTIKLNRISLPQCPLTFDLIVEVVNDKQGWLFKTTRFGRKVARYFVLLTRSNGCLLYFTLVPPSGEVERERICRGKFSLIGCSITTLDNVHADDGGEVFLSEKSYQDDEVDLSGGMSGQASYLPKSKNEKNTFGSISSFFGSLKTDSEPGHKFGFRLTLQSRRPLDLWCNTSREREDWMAHLDRQTQQPVTQQIEHQQTETVSLMSSNQLQDDLRKQVTAIDRMWKRSVHLFPSHIQNAWSQSASSKQLNNIINALKILPFNPKIELISAMINNVLQLQEKINSTIIQDKKTERISMTEIEECMEDEEDDDASKNHSADAANLTKVLYPEEFSINSIPNSPSYMNRFSHLYDDDNGIIDAEVKVNDIKNGAKMSDISDRIRFESDSDDDDDDDDDTHNSPFMSPQIKPTSPLPETDLSVQQLWMLQRMKDAPDSKSPTISSNSSPTSYKSQNIRPIVSSPSFVKETVIRSAVTTLNQAEKKSTPLIISTVSMDAKKQPAVHNVAIVDVAEWKRVMNWLDEIGMFSYVPVLKKHGCTRLSAIELMTEEELKAIGIRKSHIAIFKREIARFSMATQSRSVEAMRSRSKSPKTRLMSIAKPLAVKQSAVAKARVTSASKSPSRRSVAKVTAKPVQKLSDSASRNEKKELPLSSSRFEISPQVSAQTEIFSDLSQIDLSASLSASNEKARPIYSQTSSMIPIESLLSLLRASRRNSERKLTRNEELLVGLMQTFDSCTADLFFQLWDYSLPLEVQVRGSKISKRVCELELLARAYFALRLKTADLSAPSLGSDKALEDLKRFIDGMPKRNQEVCQSTEFALFASLPLVPYPQSHPFFRNFYSNEWNAQVRNQIEGFFKDNLLLNVSTSKAVPTTARSHSMERISGNLVDQRLAQDIQAHLRTIKDKTKLDSPKKILLNGNGVTKPTDGPRKRSLPNPAELLALMQHKPTADLSQTESKVISFEPVLVTSKKEEVKIDHNISEKPIPTSTIELIPAINVATIESETVHLTQKPVEPVPSIVKPEPKQEIMIMETVLLLPAPSQSNVQDKEEEEEEDVKSVSSSSSSKKSRTFGFLKSLSSSTIQSKSSTNSSNKSTTAKATKQDQINNNQSSNEPVKPTNVEIDLGELTDDEEFAVQTPRRKFSNNK